MYFILHFYMIPKMARKPKEYIQKAKYVKYYGKRAGREGTYVLKVGIMVY